MGDKDIVTDFGNLYRAYKKAKSGKKFNGSTAKFSSMALDGINLLKEQLENQTYKESELNKFTIHEPKERVIESCSFKDKVVQHCLCDNVMHPRLKDVFIKYNSAGQEEKGTLFAMDGLKSHMESFYQNHGIDGWILKCDIRHFFYEIDHEVLKKIVDSYFPDEYTKWLNRCFIDNSSNPGLPLGNQVAQVYALMMLDGMDHMITEKLGIELYGRYMDDFYLIHSDKEYLKFCLEEIEKILSDLKLSLNGKTQIIPFRKGIRFLGFHHYMTVDGKYIRKLTGENKRKIKKRIRKWVKSVKNGEMTERKFYEKYGAWKNHASHGNCIKLIHSMDLYVEEQIKESFKGYTEETAKEYRYCDKLGYIDCCVRYLNNCKDSEDVVNEMVEGRILYEWRENGEIIEEDDIYCFEFMEDCYNKGKNDARLYSHFSSDDHHIYDQIQKVLVKVITIVMNYED